MRTPSRLFKCNSDEIHTQRMIGSKEEGGEFNRRDFFSPLNYAKNTVHVIDICTSKDRRRYKDNFILFSFLVFRVALGELNERLNIRPNMFFIFPFVYSHLYLSSLQEGRFILSLRP